MSIPKVLEVDCSTGVETLRDATEAEIETLNQVREESLRFEAERKAEEERIAALKTSAKYKLVNGEPLTPEEAEVLVL